MRTAKLGDLKVGRIGLGAMGMSHGYTGAGSDDAGATLDALPVAVGGHHTDDQMKMIER